MNSKPSPITTAKGCLIAVVAAFALCIVVNIFSPATDQRVEATKPTITHEQSRSKEWYEGGTLHKAKIREWKMATEENKLATCGDFIANVYEVVSLPEAIELRACISETIKGHQIVDDSNVAEIAALCMVLLKPK